MQKTGMLWPGCRVAVAVSGGVDSFVLLQSLKIRQGIVPFHFEIMAIHLNPGFDEKSHAALLPWLAKRGIPGHIEMTTYGPDAHSEKIFAARPVFVVRGCAASGFLNCAASTA